MGSAQRTLRPDSRRDGPGAEGKRSRRQAPGVDLPHARRGRDVELAGPGAHRGRAQTQVVEAARAPAGPGTRWSLSRHLHVNNSSICLTTLQTGSKFKRAFDFFSDEIGGRTAMNVALTGATGFIGSHVLAALQEHGHEVTALVRDDAHAESVAARGATPAVVDLYDGPAVAGVLRDADGAIHTASPGDETSADLDSAVADAAIDAFAGTGKPYIQISGVWIYGDNPSVTEDSPVDAPAMVAYREPIERRVLGASGMRGVVIVSGGAYGDGGGGVPGVLLGSPRDDAGNLIMFGTGQQRWVTAHVADLADFFRRVLEHDSARGRYVIGDGLNPTVAEITEAAAVAVGAPGAVPGSNDEARGRLGALAEVLLLDQGTDAARAKADLDWSPSHPGLVDEFRSGSYRNGGGKP